MYSKYIVPSIFCEDNFLIPAPFVWFYCKGTYTLAFSFFVSFSMKSKHTQHTCGLSPELRSWGSKPDLQVVVLRSNLWSLIW